MKEKLAYSASSLLLATGIISSLNAAPMVSIGESVNVFFNGSASASYRSNVFSSTNNESDFVFIFSPGLEIDIGRNSNAEFNIRFFEDIIRYQDRSELDNENFNVRATGEYENEKTRINSLVAFNQVSGNTNRFGANNRIIDRDLYKADLGLEYDFSPKTFFEGGFVYDATEFTNNSFGTFSDRDSFTLPLNILYRYSQKLSLGLGYRYKHTDIDGNSSSVQTSSGRDNQLISHFGSLAIRGTIAPKLKARINLGFQNQNNANLNDETLTFSVNSIFNYQFSPKTTVTARLNRDFDSGGAGRSIEETNAGLGVDWTYNQLWSFRADIDYEFSDFSDGREDDTYRGNLGATYRPNDYLSFRAGYGITFNESSQALADFESHIVNLSARLRY